MVSGMSMTTGTERGDGSDEPAVVTTAGRRVLVVDDDPDLGACVCELMTYLGHQAAYVERGEAALARARTFAPDVIVLDVGLPELRHFDLARRLRSATSATAPLIVGMLGSNGPADQARALAFGVDEALVKPLGLHTLRRLLGTPATAAAPAEPQAWAEGSDTWQIRGDADGE